MLQIGSNSASLQDFKARLRGELICASDEGYDSARKVWNGMIDKYPVLIARCADVSDVVSAIQFARSHDLPVAVRGSGHSFAGSGTCDGGLVIDLAPMKRVQVDPVKRRAWVQAGVTLGEFVRETQVFGLATPVGTASDTGLAGLTLGGGVGWLMGKYGLTIDNLLSVEIVTVDGHVLRASPTEHAELFWGVRGGGGNFGVVTTFEFQLHPVGPLLAGMVLHPVEKASEVLHFYREFSSRVPDELTAYVVLLTSPDGLPVIAIALCYCGPLDEGKRLIEPVRTFGNPLLEAIRPMSYLELISLNNAAVPRGRHYYSTANSLKNLSEEVIETIVDYGSARTSPWSLVSLIHVHGAASRVGLTETAFALRQEHYALQIAAAWNEDMASEASTHIAWARALRKATEPFATSGVYLNLLGNHGEGSMQVQASYGANYERLVALKNTYDPTNFFHLNQNIKPTVQSR
jgi:FAD/FMN-containing dehydrogenase